MLKLKDSIKGVKSFDVMDLSEMAYNLKKYLKFIDRKVRSNAQSLCFLLIQKIGVLFVKISAFKRPEKRVIIS